MMPRLFYPILLILAVLAACAPAFEPPPPPAAPAPSGARLERSDFPALAGWQQGDQAAALTAFRRSCARISARPEAESMTGAGYGGTVADWLDVCARAATVSDSDAETRIFFETNFVPYRVFAGAEGQGLFTGYFEPELRGSRIQQGPYQTPLYGLPEDLVSIDLGAFRESLAGQRIAGRLDGNRLVPYAPRADITQNGIPGAEPVLYIDNAADAFFLQIQGSGRVRLEDGTVLRASYAGQNGHPYTAIGAVLVDRGELTRETVSMQSIRAWLDAHPESAQELLDQNASYVFFAVAPLGDPTLGAAGTQGAPLTSGASLAVDDAVHPLGIPVWLESSAPSPDGTERPLNRLLIAQDTGGAINGAVRGDIYWGVGDEAGAIAGRMRSMGTMTIFLPLALAERVGGAFAVGSGQ